MTSIPQFEASFDRLFSVQQADKPVCDKGEGEQELGNQEFFTSFYDRFMQHAAVARMFAHTDMVKQVSMLKRSIFDLVGFYVTGIPSAELARLGDVHAQLGVDPALLDVWLEALLDTVVEFDEQADELVRLAWLGALSPGLTVVRMYLLAATGKVQIPGAQR